VTPFFYFGISPTICNEKIIRTNNMGNFSSGWRFLPNTILGIGVKAKLADNINLKAEYKSDIEINELHLLFGIEYIIPTKRLNKTP
jgi:hypothetical protein